MIEPKSVTNFNRSDAELQTFWLFSIFVAGKNSDVASRCLARFLARFHDKKPFEALGELGETGIRNHLVAHRVGQYDRITKALVDSIGLDLRSCSLEDLLAVRGVGNKTARFFLLHSRPDIKVAVLDTHVLKWMASKVPEDAIPKVTPTNPKIYQALEQKFLVLAGIYHPTTAIADLDLLIWTEQSGRLD
jgi:thermostable 8-oxoguanine DNA glycosylase